MKAILASIIGLATAAGAGVAVNEWGPVAAEVTAVSSLQGVARDAQATALITRQPMEDVLRQVELRQGEVTVDGTTVYWVAGEWCFKTVLPDAFARVVVEPC